MGRDKATQNVMDYLGNVLRIDNSGALIVVFTPTDKERKLSEMLDNPDKYPLAEILYDK